MFKSEIGLRDIIIRFRTIVKRFLQKIKTVPETDTVLLVEKVLYLMYFYYIF